MLAGIANDENYDRVLVEILRHAQRGGQIRAGRAAAKYSFHSSEQARHLERLAIRYVDNFIDVLDVNVGRHNLLPDFLHQIRSRLDNLSGLFVSFENRTVRIGANDLDLRIFLFEEPACAGDSATSSESGHEVGDFTFGLSPDLRSGSSVVCCWICRIGILVWIKRVWSFRGDALRG